MAEAAFAWHRPCPACGADTPVPLHANTMAALDGLDLSYRVCRCAGCGFGYAADLPLPATYEEYYRRASKYDFAGAGTASSPTLDARIDKTLAMCRPHLPADAVVVDVGCGVGALLAGFRRLGCRQLYGIDPAPASRCEAGRLFGLDQVQVGGLRDAPGRLPLGDADLLCLTGVLEHLPRLAEDLELLLGALADKAAVLIEVPALERFLRPGMEPFGEFSLEHIQYFGAASLLRLMARFGFQPLDWRIEALPGCTDSLFALFSRRAAGQMAEMPPPAGLEDYVRTSAAAMAGVSERLPPPGREFVIYGAGSHTARLLPHMAAQAGGIVGIVDGNPNLHGKTLGGITIHPVDFLERHPGIAVLVSSCLSQKPIVAHLNARFAGRHPAITLYPDR